MHEDQNPVPSAPVTPAVSRSPAQTGHAWWKPRRQTWGILLAALGGIGVLAAFIFGGRDNSGDAAGQGLADAFEALSFVLGAALVGAVALIRWRSHYVKIPTIVTMILGLIALLILVFVW
jgi:hypothetical protein